MTKTIKHMLDSEVFIKRYKIVIIYNGDNRRIGFRCPECNATAGYLVDLPHRRSCNVPDWTGKLPAKKGE